MQLNLAHLLIEHINIYLFHLVTKYHFCFMKKLIAITLTLIVLYLLIVLLQIIIFLL